MPPDALTPAAQPQPPATPLVRSAGLTGIATLASRILGLVRDQVLAALFGAGNDMDAFLVAFRVPNLLRDLFAEGAMSAAFVPTFTRQLTLRGREDAWRLGNSVLNALLAVTGALVLLGVVFARPLVGAYAGDFAAVPGKIELTILLTRIMLPFLTLVAIAAIAMGMLNALHHYFIPALSPAMFNVATIVCAVTLVPLMPAIGQPRIMAIAIGALVGAVGQLAVQWPSLRREGFRYRPALDLADPGLRRVLLLMGPGTIGLAAVQVNLFVNTLLATSQGSGAVSWLNYAFRLMYLPIGLFGVSIATAVLPAVSRHAAMNDLPGIRQTVTRGMTMMLMLNVPATFGLLTLATPIVQLLFERGRFGPLDTAATAAALRLYAVGLVGYSAVRIVAPTFYALGQSRVPILVSLGTIALNVALNVTLVRVMGFGGLALGTSIAALANGAVLLVLLRRTLSGIDGNRLGIAVGKIAIAGLVMAAVAAGIEREMLEALPGAGLVRQAIRLTVEIGGALASLAAAASLLRIREFDEATVELRARLK
jgi:putative peptidoglycan lipid II flippase